MSYTLVPSELIVDGAITSAKLDTNISISGTLNVTGEVTLATHLNMGDNDKIKIGTGGDLEIYHDGSNSYIANSTGNIYIADTNGAVHIQAKLNEESIVAAADGAVTLYHDNSAKLATASGGVTVTGTINDLTLAAGNIETNTSNNLSINTPNSLRINIDSNNSATDQVFIIGHNQTAVDTSNALMTVLESGNVGIGTSSPSTLLHINSTSQVNNRLAIFESDINNLNEYSSISVGSSTLSATFGIMLLSSDTAYVGVGSSGNAFDPTTGSGLYVNANGNVGIGETSPSTELHVKGTNNSAGDLYTAVGSGNVPSITIQNAGTTDNNNAALFFRNDSAMVASIGARFNSHSNDETQLRFSTTNTSGETRERMVLFGDGKLGINQFNPDNLLTVDVNSASAGTDSISVQNRGVTTAGHTTGLRFQFNTAVSSAIRSLLTNTSNGEGTLSFFTSSDGTAGNLSERVRIDSSGNLLVGKTITQTNTNGLTVSANDFMSYTNDSTDSGDRCVILNRHGLNAGDIQEFRTQNASRGIISFNGSVMSYGGTSDYRLKENIKPMENGLERLNRLNPVSFDWKETGINSEGFIAHEVQEVFADVVTGQKDGKQMQTVDYGRITPLLVKAIQEQQTIIEDLKSRIETLEG